MISTKAAHTADREALIDKVARIIDGSAVDYASRCPLTGNETKQSGPILLHNYAERAISKATEIVDMMLAAAEARANV